MEEVNLADISPVVEKYRGRHDGLISALQETQDIYGYLPETALCHLSRELNIAMSKVYSVATFYAQFYLERRGRNIVRVCRGTACHVRGGKAVLNSIENRLGIKDGQTTGDYKFTLETVACLGACAMGPVIMVGEKYYGKMTPAKIEALLDTF
ncbi:MAG: NADH-quinone oxidoreductase subunit NuoE [Dehalococcoidaceae bacterium]|nr:NADH-quinone oxidoreductase subunit NuoE [Dehalococcoidaceae bacterium]